MNARNLAASSSAFVTLRFNLSKNLLFPSTFTASVEGIMPARAQYVSTSAIRPSYSMATKMIKRSSPVKAK